jgi:hypothetical protein
MTAVLFAPRDRALHWPEARAWQGLRVSSVAEVVALC